MYCSIYSSCYRCVVAAFVRIPFPCRRLPCGGLYKSIKISGIRNESDKFFRNLPWGVPYPPLQSAFFCRFSRTLSRVALPPSPVRRVPIYIYNPRKTRWLCGEFPGVAGGLPAGRLRGYPFRSRCFDRNLRTGSSYSLRHSHARITEPKKSARAPGSDSRNVRSPFLTQA